jgi:hypothetical protein
MGSDRCREGQPKEKREGTQAHKKGEKLGLRLPGFSGARHGSFYISTSVKAVGTCYEDRVEKKGEREKGNTKVEPAGDRLHGEDDERHIDKDKRENLLK